MKKDFTIIPACIGMAAANPQTLDGPIYLQDNQLKDYLWESAITISGNERGFDALPKVLEFSQALAQKTNELVKAGKLFLTMGGDHSCAIGTWSGVAAAVDGELGLIWVDAHFDSHTPETSHSQNIHGMPVSALLGHGHVGLVDLIQQTPALKPENICFIGIRDYEPEEQKFVDDLGIKVFYMESVKEQGLKSVFQQALQHVTKQTKAFGLSIDVDGVDAKDAPGTGLPIADGIRGNELTQVIHGLAQQEQFIGAEIAEFNPHNDVDVKTAILIKGMVESIFAR